MTAQPSSSTAPKIMVAVHGIGDQTTNATAQSVAFRVFDYYDLPPAIPIGRFQRAPNAPGGAMLLKTLKIPALPGDLGFAEVYWADVPRDLVKDGYTLEEAKRWARTIVARLNVRARGSAPDQQLSIRQYKMLETVVDELVDAVFVLDNITFLADRAGIFKFDLKSVLDDFLNDVQVVTEFKHHRDRILDKFDAVMEAVAADADAPAAEIYLVAHSEGSVIAFFGLLRALSKDVRPEWVKRVRGLMTIGSPIETHVLLWENLWDYVPHQTTALPQGPIPWRNYYDYGDPIAYKLEETRRWMTKQGWMQFFEHDESHDVGFARYPLPGKAHVDYWNDAEVFAHFIEDVVKPPRPEKRSEASAAAPPTDRRGISTFTAVLPYVLVGALMFLACYLLYKPLSDAMIEAKASTPLTARGTFADILAFALLLAGMTAAVRVPRLTRPSLWWVAAIALLGGALWSYPHLVDVQTSKNVTQALGNVSWNLVTFSGNVGQDSRALLVLVLAATVIATIRSYLKPARGVWPLLVPGSLLAAGLVVGLLRSDNVHADVWPLLLGAVGFLYLWWLATLLFDLTVVWHSYVRWATAVDTMRAMTTQSKTDAPAKG